MIEILLSALTVILIVVAGWIAHVERLALAEQIGQRGEMMKVNLDHIAGALVSMSELLDSAEDVIESASEIPSVGEMLLQMGSQMLMSRLAPTIEPFADPGAVIRQLIPADESHAETPNQDQEVETEI